MDAPAMIFGILLVLVGSIFLAATLGLIGGVTAGELWPVLLIGLGLASISGSVRYRAWRRSSRGSRRYWSDE